MIEGLVIEVEDKRRETRDHFILNKKKSLNEIIINNCYKMTHMNSEAIEYLQAYLRIAIGDIVIQDNYIMHLPKKNEDQIPFEIDLNGKMLLLGEDIDTGDLKLIISILNEVENEFPNQMKLELFVQSNSTIMNNPKIFSQLNFIDTLYLPDKLSAIPREIFDLENLTSLGIPRGNITGIPKEISNLRNLKVLNLNDNKIREISEEVCNLRNLEELSLNWNYIKEVPETIANLKNLKILGLHSNRIENIPESIGHLKLLEELNLGKNRLKSIPKSIKNMGNLRSIVLKGNFIKGYPEILRHSKARISL